MKLQLALIAAIGLSLGACDCSAATLTNLQTGITTTVADIIDVRADQHNDGFYYHYTVSDTQVDGRDISHTTIWLGECLEPSEFIFIHRSDTSYDWVSERGMVKWDNIFIHRGATTASFHLGSVASPVAGVFEIKAGQNIYRQEVLVPAACCIPEPSCASIALIFVIGLATNRHR